MDKIKHRCAGLNVRLVKMDREHIVCFQRTYTIWVIFFAVTNGCGASRARAAGSLRLIRRKSRIGVRSGLLANPSFQNRILLYIHLLLVQ
jgi:hypothetical protein